MQISKNVLLSTFLFKKFYQLLSTYVCIEICYYMLRLEIHHPYILKNFIELYKELCKFKILYISGYVYV